MPTASLVPLSKIRALPGNPKDHDLGTISESMDRFGFIERVVINQPTGHIISGHGRIDTLRRLKAMAKPIPAGVEVDKSTNEWLVPVDYIDIQEEEEMAAAVALNRLVEIGGWNDQDLTQALSDLAAQGEEMLRGVGFDMDDVDTMLAKLEKDMRQKEAEETGELLEEELAPADVLLAKWGVESGDIWEVAGHYIICGDATNAQTWKDLTQAAGVQGVDGIFTSPPYADQRSKSNVPNYMGIPVDRYVQWWSDIQNNAYEHLLVHGSFFLNIKPNVADGERVLYVFDLVLAMVRQWYWHLIDEFCWERVGNPGSWPNRFKNGFEPVYQFAKQTQITFNPKEVAIPGEGERRVGGNDSTGNYYNVDHKTLTWDAALPSNRIPTFGNAMGTLHPAAFPTGLPEFFIKAFSDDGAVWLDPFGGSGTLAVAAQRTGRTALMIEMEPKYVAVTLERLHNLTGEQPRKV